MSTRWVPLSCPGRGYHYPVPGPVWGYPVSCQVGTPWFFLGVPPPPSPELDYRRGTLSLPPAQTWTRQDLTRENQGKTRGYSSVDKQTPVKRLPSRRTTYAGGSQVEMPLQSILDNSKVEVIHGGMGAVKVSWKNLK